MSFAIVRRLGLTAALLLLPTAAFAHPGHVEAGGLLHGVAHPLSGPDHILAMVMVGVIAWQLGGRALLLLPATFIGVMALGGALGMSGVALPFVETGIAVSVVVLGAIVAFGLKAPLAPTMALVGLFAVFHGYAHGVELPAGAGGLEFGLGFIAATAFLHALGIALGFGLGRLAERVGPVVTRTAGALVGLAGAGIMAGII